MTLRRAAALVAALGLLWSLAAAGEAAAEDCVFGGGAASWHTAGAWSCGHVPDGGDDVFIGSFSDVSVAADASAGSLTQSAGTVSFSNDATLAVAGSADAGGDLADAQNGSVFWQGNGTLSVGGSFTKTGDGTLYVRNDAALQSADLVLNGASTLSEGAMCVATNNGSATDNPNLYINNNFTIATGAAATAFNCTPGVPTVHVNAPDGHLIKAAAGVTSSLTGIENDGTSRSKPAS